MDHLSTALAGILLPLSMVRPYREVSLFNLTALSVFFPSISLTVAQNEDVVEQFLQENASAGEFLCSVEFLHEQCRFIMVEQSGGHFYRHLRGCSARVSEE